MVLIKLYISRFCSVFAMQSINFLKNTNPKNEILFLFCRPIYPIFFAVLPADEKK